MTDYIEREAVFCIVHGYCHPANIEDEIAKLPAADVAPVVRGHWVKKNDGICYWHECSECGERMPLSIYGVDYYSHYCPNCGAQMDADMREVDDG